MQTSRADPLQSTHDRGDDAGVKGADRLGAGFEFVAKREILDEVADRVHAQAGEGFSAVRAYASDVLNGDLERDAAK